VEDIVEELQEEEAGGEGVNYAYLKLFVPLRFAIREG
jgi:hypothetical protein